MELMSDQELVDYFNAGGNIFPSQENVDPLPEGTENSVDLIDSKSDGGSSEQNCQNQDNSSNNKGSLLPTTIADGGSKSVDPMDLDPTDDDLIDSILRSIQLESAPGSTGTAAKQHSGMQLPAYPEWAIITNPGDLAKTGGIVPTPVQPPETYESSAPPVEQASGQVDYAQLLTRERRIKEEPTELDGEGVPSDARTGREVGQEATSNLNNNGITEVKSRKRKPTLNPRQFEEQPINNGIIVKEESCETTVAPIVKRARCKEEQESSDAEGTTSNANGKKKISNKESAKRQREKKKAEFLKLTLEKEKRVAEKDQLSAEIDSLHAKLQGYQNQNCYGDGDISCGTFMEDLIRKTAAPDAIIVTIPGDEDDEAFKLPAHDDPHGNRVYINLDDDSDPVSQPPTSVALRKPRKALRSITGKKSNALAAKQNRERKKAERNNLEVQIKKLNDQIPKLRLEVSRLQKICDKWNHVNALRNFIVSGNFHPACKGVVAFGRECSCMNFTIAPWFYKVFIPAEKILELPSAGSGSFIQQLIFSEYRDPSVEIDFRAERVVLA